MSFNDNGLIKKPVKRNDTIIDIAKSQPINIIKPEKTKIKKSTDFFPSSPYTV